MSSAINSRTQYLTFVVSGEEYAVPILRVREIIEYSGFTRVPGMPAHVAGVINLRGSIIPVVDLAVRFGIGSSVILRTSCVVVGEFEVEGQPIVAGMIADAVRQVVEVEGSDVEATPAFGTRAAAEYIVGITLIAEKLVLLLDVDKLLDTTDLGALAESESGDEALVPAQEVNDNTSASAEA